MTDRSSEALRSVIGDLQPISLAETLADMLREREGTLRAET
jgi:hypothetical protein